MVSALDSRSSGPGQALPLCVLVQDTSLSLAVTLSGHPGVHCTWVPLNLILGVEVTL